MQVRFISVNDNYDSISPECDNQMLGIMISNLANDMYAKDISKKVRQNLEYIAENYKKVQKRLQKKSKKGPP